MYYQCHAGCCAGDIVWRVLQKGHIAFWVWVSVWAVVSDISYDAHNLAPVRWIAQTETFAERVLAREETLCQRLVNDDYAGRSLVVAFREETSFKEGDAHGLKIVSADQTIFCKRLFPLIHDRASFYLKDRRVPAQEGHVANCRYLLNSGH